MFAELVTSLGLALEVATSVFPSQVGDNAPSVSSVCFCVCMTVSGRLTLVGCFVCEGAKYYRI